MAINAGSVYSEMILDISKYQQNLEKAEKQMNNFTTKLKSAGDKMQSIGKSLTTKLSLPIAAAGAASLKFAGDFEESINKVSTIADTAVKSTDEIKEGIINLSDEIGIASTELSEALYQTISATGDTANSLDYVEVASKAAIGGFTDTATAIDGLTTVLNAYGLKGSEAMQKVSDQMLMAQNYGKTTFGEMASSIGNVIPIAASLNITTEELFGSIATLTKNGIQTSQAITGLKAAYSNILKPSEEAAELAANLGIEFNAAHLKSVGWAKFLDEIREKTGGNSEQLATLFSSVEALNSVTVLATTGAEDFSGALDAMNESAEATEKAFAKMDQGTKDIIEDTLNKVKNLGIELAETFMPTINKLLDKVSGWIDKFKALDDGTKETIVKMAGLAAAIGPVLMVGGKMASGISSIIGLFVKFKAASTAATGATKLMAGGIGKAGLAAKAGALLLNPWTIGIAAATAGGIALYKHLQKDSIPTIDLFGETVSESTKKAVGGFLELEEKATISLKQLSWSGQAMTEEMKENITSNFEQMSQQIVTATEKQKTEALASLDELFSNSKTITEEEKEEMIRITAEKYDEQIQKTEEGTRRITEILEKAKEENRSITEEEKNEITKIKEEMKEDAIRILSENEAEQMAIMERLKANSSELSAQQAAEIVKNSLKQKEETIAAAEEEYNERLKYAAQLRASGSKEAEELANRIIEEATRQTNEAIKNAEEMHDKVVEQAKLQAGEHINQINWETGEIKSKWEVMRDDITQKAKEIKDDIIAKWEEIKKSTAEKWGNVKTAVSNSISTIKDKIDAGIDKIKEWNKTNVKEKVFSIVNKVKNVISTVKEKVSGIIGHNAQGTNYWRGGLTWVGEQGPELIELPRGSKVYSNSKSIEMAGSMGRNITQNITINSPTPLNPSEIAKKNLQVSRQLAMEWGV